MEVMSKRLAFASPSFFGWSAEPVKEAKGPTGGTEVQQRLFM
jgi:hypothetical protein